MHALFLRVFSGILPVIRVPPNASAREIMQLHHRSLFKLQYMEQELALLRDELTRCDRRAFARMCTRGCPDLRTIRRR